MAFLSAMDICGSGLTAQRMRLDVASENIANMGVTRTEAGGPYRRKMVVFEPIGDSNFRSVLRATAANRGMKGGVRVAEIVEDTRPSKPVYNPDHPDADENGYVMMPNVDLLKETVDSMEASRAYDANVTALNVLKQMASKALEIGK